MQYIYIYIKYITWLLSVRMHCYTQLILDSLHHQLFSKWFARLELGHAPLNFSYPPIVYCITLLQVNIARAFASQKNHEPDRHGLRNVVLLHICPHSLLVYNIVNAQCGCG